MTEITITRKFVNPIFLSDKGLTHTTLYDVDTDEVWQLEDNEGYFLANTRTDNFVLVYQSS